MLFHWISIRKPPIARRWARTVSSPDAGVALPA
jgi:hypothetical protein